MKTTAKKILLTSILAGALTIGVNACTKQEEHKQKPEGNITEPKKPEKKITNTNKGYSEIDLYLMPESKTGKTLQVLASTWDGGYYPQDCWNVKLIRLYEDGKLIKEQAGDDNRCVESILIDVRHKEQSTHSYFAEVVYENDNVKKSEPKQVVFIGRTLDLPPKIGFYGGISLFGTKIVIDADDYGDNKGIKKAKIYEDGKLWKNFDYKPKWILHQETPASVYEVIQLDLSEKGKHKYYAEFTDQGGNAIKTETIVVDYDKFD